MKFFILLISFITLPLFAQQHKEFQQYLDHFKEMQPLPSVWTDDSIVFYGDSSTIISPKQAQKFLFSEKPLPQDFFREHQFLGKYYIKTKNFVLTIVTKYCECGFEFGINLGQIILSTYTPNGEKISQTIIGSSSCQHNYQTQYSLGNSPEKNIQVNIKNGTFLVCDYNTNTFLGMVEYRQINIDSQGHIQDTLLKTTHFNTSEELYSFDTIKEW